MKSRLISAVLLTIALQGCGSGDLTHEEASTALEWFFTGAADIDRGCSKPVRIADVAINSTERESVDVIAVSIDFSVSPSEDVVVPSMDDVAHVLQAKIDHIESGQKQMDKEQTKSVCNAVRFQLFYPVAQAFGSRSIQGLKSGDIAVRQGDKYPLKHQSFRFIKVSEGWRIVTPTMSLTDKGPGFQNSIMQ